MRGGGEREESEGRGREGRGEEEEREGRGKRGEGRGMVTSSCTSLLGLQT